MYVCIYIYSYLYLYLFLYYYIFLKCICMYVYIYMYMYVCMYIYIYVFIDFFRVFLLSEIPNFHHDRRFCCSSPRAVRPSEQLKDLRAQQLQSVTAGRPSLHLEPARKRPCSLKNQTIQKYYLKSKHPIMRPFGSLGFVLRRQFPLSFQPTLSARSRRLAERRKLDARRRAEVLLVSVDVEAHVCDSGDAFKAAQPPLLYCWPERHPRVPLRIPVVLKIWLVHDKGPRTVITQPPCRRQKAPWSWSTCTGVGHAEIPQSQKPGTPMPMRACCFHGHEPLCSTRGTARAEMIAATL